MQLLKLITTRNAFSREYGTWLIVLFNFILVPLLTARLPSSLGLFWLSILFFLMFRFIVLDILSLSSDVPKKKYSVLLLYLILAAATFLCWALQYKPGVLEIIVLVGSGILMLMINLLTRRKKGKRQYIPAQILLVCYIAALNAYGYYIATNQTDEKLWYIFIFSSLFYTNSVLYVRSKTEGSPYDVIALIFALLIVLFVLAAVIPGFLQLPLIILFIPGLVKNLDNVVLSNTKVPLRRIGISETIHCTIFVFLFILLVA